MTIVERPNQEALTKAIDIYLDAIRPFLTHNLRQVSGRTVEESVLQSLPPDRAEYFAQNRPLADSLESALEASHVEFILNHYWIEVFSPFFRNSDVVFVKLRSVTAARNQVSHPAFRRDLDGDATLEYFDALLFLLGTIGAREESEAVAVIRAEAANPGEAGRKAAREFEWLEEQYQQKVVELGETEGFLCQVESELEVARGKLRQEESARVEAEKAARVAQVLLTQTTEVLKKEVAVRTGAEELPSRKVRALQMVEQATQLVQGALTHQFRQLRVAMARLETAKRREALRNRQAVGVKQSHKMFRATTRSTRGQHSSDSGLLAKSTVAG